MGNQVDLEENIRIIRRLGHGGAVSNCAHDNPLTSHLLDEVWSSGCFRANIEEFQAWHV
jgi:hypothetical protein